MRNDQPKKILKDWCLANSIPFKKFTMFAGLYVLERIIDGDWQLRGELSRYKNVRERDNAAGRWAKYFRWRKTEGLDK